MHGGKTGPSRADRRRAGSKHHLAVDAHGTPLAATLAGANRHDVTQLVPPVEAIPPSKGKAGAPLRKPKVVMGDRGYNSDPHRLQLSGKGIATRIARRGAGHGSGPGTFRYVVEQTIALSHQFRHLRVRVDKRDDIHETFVRIGQAMICWRRPHSSAGYF
jgi:transposase